MTDEVAVPAPPSWANDRTVVLADTALAGPVAERGDLLYRGLVNLLQVSGVESFGDLRAAAVSDAALASFLEVYEENLAVEMDEGDDQVVVDPSTSVREELVEWYVGVLPAPWIVDGAAGWEIDQLRADVATVSGASPGGNADWAQFTVGVDDLAVRLRDLGLLTVRVPSGVFEQFFGFPVDQIGLDEGQPLTAQDAGA